MNPDLKIAILLPAYNEEKTIATTVKDFHFHLPQASIVVIDNGSTDKTQPLVKEVFQTEKIKGKILFEPQKGKAFAVRRGILQTKADIFLMADADNTYPAADAKELLTPIWNNQADMVVGNRNHQGIYQKKNKRRFHFFGNSMVRSLVNFLFAAKLNDIMSGYRAFHRSFIELYPNLSQGFELETDLTLFALDKRFRIQEVPIHYQERPEGSLSKLSTFRDGARVLFCIAQILRYYRPFFFFTCLSFAIGFLGLIAAYPVFWDWFSYRYIYHIPLAILASSLELVALIAFAMGLILDAISRHSKVDFEYRYQKSLKFLKKNKKNTSHLAKKKEKK